MSFRVEGKDTARSKALASIDVLEKRFGRNVEKLVHDIDTYIKSKTPVYTGQAVRNYIWTAGEGSGTVHEAIDNGPTGNTNSMALGMEPRRGVNEAAAFQSLASMSFANPFAAFTLTNNSPDIEGLEYGTYPGAPLSSRSPNGMFGITQRHFMTVIGQKGMLS
jgi:hypothetical protein